jgi:hypothetical protein
MSVDPRAAFAYLKMSTEYGFEPPCTLCISRDTYSILRPTKQIFSISTTSLSDNFQILNIKVHIDEEILKTTNASKNECKRRDHTIQRTNAKPEARQTDCEKLRKTFLNSNAT